MHPFVPSAAALLLAARLVGTAVAVQGITVLGSQCLGFLDLSDTIICTIR